MTCEWLVCCSDIRREPDGLVSLIGVHGAITFKNTPHTVKTLTVAAKFAGLLGESAHVRIGLYAEDGTEIQSQSDRVALTPYAFLVGAFSFHGITFSSPTCCHWIAHIDGNEVRRSTLTISRVT